MVRDWLATVGVTPYIEPDSPWENGSVERLNDNLRDELLNGEIFHTVHEAKVFIERWRRHYNTVRPHSSLGYRAPAPETVGVLPKASLPGRSPQRSGRPGSERRSTELSDTIWSVQRGNLTHAAAH